MPSFDIVSELELFEVNHAVQNTQKEIATRFDFRGHDVSIELNEKNKEIKISTESDFQCEQVYNMLTLIQQKINKAIKESGIKVQSSIQGDKIRVTDKKRDTLQQVMAFLREQQFGLPLQFNNFKD
ncbi:DUF520 family protein [Acinetobacter baumannii]